MDLERIDSKISLKILQNRREKLESLSIKIDNELAYLDDLIEITEFHENQTKQMQEVQSD